MNVKYILIVCTIFSAIMTRAQNTFPTTGYVGIGTLSPVGYVDIFSIHNTTISPLISLRSNFHITGNYGMIRFGDYTQTTDYQKGALIYESVSGSARGKFHIAMENTDSPGSVNLADARLTVLSDGNVGIGTTSPKEKLSVMGKIRAQEVKIEMNNWPDYVFTNDYPLITLTRLRDYININHHLPDIPSAFEASEHGISLGDMTKKLLGKIEELTLYAINQDEDIQMLIKENSLLMKNQKDQLALFKEFQTQIEKIKISSYPKKSKK